MYTSLNALKNLTKSFFFHFGWNKFSLFFVGGLLVGGLFASLSVGTNSRSQAGVEQNVPLVSLQNVGELSSDGSFFSLIGEVKSISEASVFTEASGIVQYVSSKLGDSISRGALLAEIENSSERAAVATAAANLAQTEAAFSRDVSQVYTSAKNSYRNAFTLASDAVFGKTDIFFSAPRTSDPRLTISSFGATTLERDRGNINDILRVWEQDLTALTNESIEAQLSTAERNLETIKLFLDQLATIVNHQSGLSSEKTALFSARANVDSALSSVTRESNALAQTLGFASGGTGEADAKIASAQANLAAARAILAKTIIRAPISGTINAINLEAGDFVASFTEVATIANNNALTITTHISATARDRIAVGDTVLLEDIYEGTISNIAPAINPATKKIEVKIQTATNELTNGDTVRIMITIEKPKKNGPPLEIIIPITALKVETDRTIVFSVTANNTLTAHEVTIGPLVGDRIVVESGITAEQNIVTDARGLNEGDIVIVAS